MDLPLVHDPVGVSRQEAERAGEGEKGARLNEEQSRSGRMVNTQRSRRSPQPSMASALPLTPAAQLD